MKFGDLGWSKILKNSDEKIIKSANKKILTATSFGGELSMPILESLVSAGLVVRGAEVHVLLCDGLSACQLCDTTRFSSTQNFIDKGISKTFCKNCYSTGDNIYKSLGLKIHKFSDFLNDDDLVLAENISHSMKYSHIEKYKFNNISVGEHAVAGTCRYFAKANFSDEELGEKVLRKYLSSSIKVSIAVQNLLNQENFDCSFFNHGIYVPQGIIGEVARQNKIRVVNWNTAYRKQTYIFSHHDTYHHTMMNEDPSVWNKIDLNPNLKSKINKYIQSRALGTNDWISFNKVKETKKEDLFSLLKLDKNKPIIGLLTNVAWDAQLHYPANAFPDMLDWIIKTIKYFKKRNDLQLLIRVHPAEITGHLKSRQLVYDEIIKEFKQIPKNIFIINSNMKINTYSSMSFCDSVLIYGTKMGVELTSMGIPVIVAGEAWIRNKNITIDVESEKHYYEILNKLPSRKRLDSKTQDLALKYAFHFFFRKMIPVDLMKPTNGHPGYMFQINSLDDLKPGKYEGLDVICDGILNGSEFIIKAEKNI